MHGDGFDFVQRNYLTEVANIEIKIGREKSGIELDRIELPDIPELSPEAISNVPDGSSILLRGGHGQGGLATILATLDKQTKSGHFLHTFTSQIEEINRMIRMKYASTKDIASVILKDPALSTKVLTIVNSSYYGHFSQKGISSISEAMVILGTEEIQQVASTLLLFEFMQDISKSELLKEKSLASLMRGMVAKDVAEEARYPNKDEFQLIAMLYDIGEQIILFCDLNAYQHIGRFSKEQRVGLEKASKQLLGASFGQIGQGIVTQWGFPPQVVQAIRPFKAFKKSPNQLTANERKGLVASFSHAMCTIDWRKGEIHRVKQMEKIIRRYDRFLGLGFSKAEALLDKALDRIENHAKILKIKLKESRFDRAGGHMAPSCNEIGEGTPQPTLCFNGAIGEPVRPDNSQDIQTASSLRKDEGPGDGEDPMVWVRRRMLEIEAILARPYKLSMVLHTIMTTVYKGFFFSRIAICIVNKRDQTMAIRYALCHDADHFSSRFKFTISDDQQDIFNKALNTGMDIIVEDLRAHELLSQIPEWYQGEPLADSFAIYPLVIRQKKVGMIYVDWDRELSGEFTNEVKQAMYQLKTMTLFAIKKSVG